MTRKTRSIETEMRIEAPVEAVWDALTRAEELVRWFPLEAGENPDGSLWMSWGEGFRFEGRSAESDPPHRIRFVYSQPPPGRDPASLKPEGFAQIATEYVLESEGGTTLLRLVHSGFGTDAEWDDQFEGTRTGWDVELRGLRHYLEKHRGRDRVVAWAKAPFTATRAETWDRILSPRGLLAEGTLEGAPCFERRWFRRHGGALRPPAEFRRHGRALESGSPSPAPRGSLRAAGGPPLAFDLRCSPQRGSRVPEARAGGLESLLSV